MKETGIRAVFWDFGGVILSSPFEAFAGYEAEAGLPDGFIRSLNAANPDANAWAKLERSEVDLDTFCRLFEAEARAAGGELDARTVISLLSGEVRPEMVEALRAIGRRYRTACLTNNVRAATRTPERAHQVAEVMRLFDHVIESSKVGGRLPDRLDDPDRAFLPAVLGRRGVRQLLDPVEFLVVESTPEIRTLVAEVGHLRVPLELGRQNASHRGRGRTHDQLSPDGVILPAGIVGCCGRNELPERHRQSGFQWLSG